MHLISHRGNINGKNVHRENSPEYLTEALGNGYDVEIDVWYKNNSFRLGHDKPQYPVEEFFLENNKLWCHAKNFLALEKMLRNKKIHSFWHQEDDFTITSRGFIWTYPRKGLRYSSVRSIFVMPEVLGITSKKRLPKCAGVCSDYVANFK